MGFAVDLLDGFDVLYRRTEGELKVSTEMANYFKKLSLIEAEYAKALLKLSRSFAPKKLISSPHLDGTVKSSWTSIFEAIETIGLKHESFSQTLMKDYCNGVNEFVKDKEVVRKRLTNDGMKITRDMKAQLEVLSKAKANYVKLSKEAEAAAGAVSKGQSESAQQKKLAVLQQKAQQASEKASVADQEYKESLKTTNAKQNDFYSTEMPNLLNEFQQFEEERITFTKSTLTRYVTLFYELPPVLQAGLDTIKGGIDRISEQQDIDDFVAENKTGVTPPPPIEYQAYESVLAVSPASPTTPPAVTTASPKIGVYKPPKDNNKEWGISSKDQELSSDQKKAKLEQQMQEIDNLIKTENTAKAGVEKLVTFYASDPSAQKKVEGQVADSEIKLRKLRESQMIVSSQLAELQGAINGYTSPPNEGADGANSPLPVLLKVRGLYDFAASCETELSFKEGDILSITEQDVSGWWYAEIEGRAGFIPQNYVEII